MALSGGIDITQDRILTSGEKLTNPKVNEATTFTARVKANSITSRELAAAFSTQYFDTVADFRANTGEINNNTLVYITGYYTAGANDAGDPFKVDTADVSTADDGLSCLVDANGLRIKRTLVGMIDLRQAGLRGAPDGTETYATVNQAAWDAAKAVVTNSSASGILIPRDPTANSVFYFSGTLDIPADCEVRIDGYIKRKTLATGKFLQFGGDNITVHGSGTVDGNTNVTDDRVGSNLLESGGNDYVQINDLTWRNAASFVIGVFDAFHVQIRRNKIYNTYGSIDAAEPDDVSGDNCDGIHVFSSSSVWIEDNYIESLDDAIAYTLSDTLSAGTEFQDVWIQNNVCFLKKAENVAAPGHGGSGTAGTISAFLGGLRVTNEGGVLTQRISNVYIKNNTIHEGQGLKIGTTATTLPTAPITEYVRNCFIEGNTFVQQCREYASDAARDTIYQNVNSVDACIFMHGVKNVHIRNNNFVDFAIKGILIRTANRVFIEGNYFQDMVTLKDTGGTNMIGTSNYDESVILARANPATQDITHIEVRRNKFINFPSSAINFQSQNGGGAFEQFYITDNELFDGNADAHTTEVDGSGIVVSGTGIDGTEIREYSGNKFYNHTLSGEAQEQFLFFMERRQSLTKIEAYAAGITGSGQFFNQIDNSGLLSYTGPAVVDGFENAILLEIADLDEIRTAPNDSDTYGKPVVWTFWVKILQGDLALNTAGLTTFGSPYRSSIQRRFSTEKWEKITVKLSYDGNAVSRFRFTGTRVNEVACTAMAVASGAAWLTSTAYVVGDYVTETGLSYKCLVDHTSGTFSTDLAANKWVGVTTITAAGHPFEDGDKAVIDGTTNYDGMWDVTGVSGNNFDVATVFVADDATGTTYEPTRFYLGAIHMETDA